MLALALGVVMALLIARTDLPCKPAFEFLIITPLFMSPFTGLMAWRGVIPMERLPERMRRMVGTNWVGPGAHVITYPLRGGALMNVVGIVERNDWQGESWTQAGSADELLHVGSYLCMGWLSFALVFSIARDVLFFFDLLVPPAYVHGAAVLALVAGAVLHGAVVMTGTPVNGFRRIGRRVVAVQTDTDEIACGQVVLAAGAWTATLAR